MSIVINGNGIDMGNNPVSNASQIDGVVINENGDNVATTSNLVGFKNYIINGNFDIWQRGTSQTCTSAAFQYGSVDRFCLVNTEATNYTISRVSIDGTEPFSANYFVRNVVPLNTTSGIVFDQHIENLKMFSNKTVTLSMWVKGDAGKKIGLGYQANYGSGGTPSASDSILGKVFILTGSWQKVVMTTTLPDVIISKTYGTNGDNYLRVCVAFSSGSTHMVPEIFFQSGTFDIAQVQLEEGSVATPFENRPYGLELSLCQRYYESGVSQPFLGQAPTYDNIGQMGTANFAVTKRVPPTMSSTGTNFLAFYRVYNNIAIFKSDSNEANTSLWTASAEL